MIYYLNEREVREIVCAGLVLRVLRPECETCSRNEQNKECPNYRPVSAQMRHTTTRETPYSP